MSSFDVVYLTPRELEVLKLYLRLGSRDLVCTKLGLSIHTVRNHLETCYKKLNVSNAIGAAHKLGWLNVPD